MTPYNWTMNQRITRFNMFTDEELDLMESAFCLEKLIDLVGEIRRERMYRENSQACMDFKLKADGGIKNGKNGI